MSLMGIKKVSIMCNEKKTTNCRWWRRSLKLLVAAALIILAVFIYNDWDDFKASFNEGYESTRNK